MQENREITEDMASDIMSDWIKRMEVMGVLFDKKVQLKVKRNFYKTAVSYYVRIRMLSIKYVNTLGTT